MRKRIYTKNDREVIPNTNGRYEATVTGHIYDNKHNRFVSENESKRGWLKCHIWYNNKRITIGVHRLIMYAFYGISDLTVNHINGDKHDNSLINLEYMSIKDQNIHRSKILKRGNRKPVICLDNGKYYDTIRNACDDLGIEYENSHISEVCKNKYGFKTSHGYRFKYAD